MAQTPWPRISAVSPSGGQRGTTVELTVTGINVGRGTGLLFQGSGLTVESVTPEKPAAPKEGEKPAEAPKNPAGKLVAKVRIASDAEPGIRAVRVLTPIGPSDIAWFAVGQWPELGEKEPNNSRGEAQAVSFPLTITGAVNPAEDVDQFRFHARAGQTLVFEVLAARLDGPLDSILSVQNAEGRELALNEDFNGLDSLLAFTVPATGDYFLTLRDLRYQGGDQHGYRLSIGEFPYVTAVFPLGGPPGATVPMELAGFNLGPQKVAPVALPADAPAGLMPMTLALPGGISNRIQVAVSPAPEVTETEPNDDPAAAPLLTLPASVNGRIMPVDAAARSDVDCYRVRLAKDEKVTLGVTARRCGSALDSLLSVRDASGKELAVNDDRDGSKDSWLEFTAPESAEYVVRISDLNERGGAIYPYRLAIERAAPDFGLAFTPDRLAVPRGGRVPLVVTAERLQGFEGEIALEVAGLPTGVSVVGPSRIRAGQKEANLVLTAGADAPLDVSGFRVVGTATIDGQPVRRAAEAREEVVRNNEKRTRPSPLPTAAAAEPADMVVAAPPGGLTLSQGQSVEIAVKVERGSGFKGKVPLAVLGLPEGVTANAPDIPEDKAEGKVTLKAEGEAKPGEWEIVVAGRSVIDDQRQVLHAAAPIVLTVSAAEKKP